MVKAKRRSLDVKQGRLPNQYRNIIANSEWHSWSIPPEDMAIRERKCLEWGFPVTMMNSILQQHQENMESGFLVAMTDSILQEHQKNVEIVIKLARLVLGEQTIALDNKKALYRTHRNH